MKQIYAYNDHRIFLKDWFTTKKEEPSGFSYQKFSRLAGLGSPNYMKLVIEGKRNLTVTNILQVAKAMALTFDETQYFEALTHLGQSRSPGEKNYFRERLQIFKKNKPPRPVLLKGHELLARWYFPAVTVCLDGMSPESAAAATAAKTGLKKEQVEEVIRLLEREGMLKSMGGRFRVEYSHFIVHDKKSLSEANKAFIREQMQIALTVLEKNYAKGPKFFAHTFTAGKESFPNYVEKINAFVESLAAESNAESPEEVLQLNLQFFRLLDR